MKIKEGNSPSCWSCYYYEEINPARRNGWCYNPYNCTHGINSRKREKPLERIPMTSSMSCSQWEDAETRTNHFDYVTGKYKEKEAEQ